MAPFYLVSNPRNTHLVLKPREGLVRRSVKQETLRKGRRNLEVRFAKRHLSVYRWLTRGSTLRCFECTSSMGGATPLDSW